MCTDNMSPDATAAAGPGPHFENPTSKLPDLQYLHLNTELIRLPLWLILWIKTNMHLDT